MQGQSVQPYDWYAGRRRAILMARNGGLNAPCPTTTGAIKDFWKYVIAYKDWATTFCWPKLPESIKNSHISGARTLATALVDAVFAGIPPSSGGAAERENTVSSPVAGSETSRAAGACASASGAMAEYVEKVIAYPEYASTGCWKMMPKDVKAAHAQAMRTVIGSMVDATYGGSSKGGGATNQDENRAAGVLPCVSTKGALKDYMEEVVGYRVFAGSGCFMKLPKGLQSAFTTFSNTMMTEVQQALAKAGGQGVDRAVLAYSKPPYAPRPCTINHNYPMNYQYPQPYYGIGPQMVEPSIGPSSMGARAGGRGRKQKRRPRRSY